MLAYWLFRIKLILPGYDLNGIAKGGIEVYKLLEAMRQRK